MLFAEMSAEGWSVIIGAIFLGILQIIREIRATIQAREAAKAVVEAKQLIQTNTNQQAAHAEVIAEKVDQAVQEVKKATGT